MLRLIENHERMLETLEPAEDREQAFHLDLPQETDEDRFRPGLVVDLPRRDWLGD